MYIRNLYLMKILLACGPASVFNDKFHKEIPFMPLCINHPALDCLKKNKQTILLTLSFSLFD